MSLTSIRLLIMMFLQFFVWGAWYVTAPNYLGTIGFDAGDFAWTYSVGPIAGIITPLFVGMVADRFLPAQIVLGLLHLLGAGLIFAATQLMGADSQLGSLLGVQGVSPNAINGMFFGYMLTYFPTLALTNTVAMRNMVDPQKEFPWIRVGGTIGWIAANQAVSRLGYDTSIDMFYLTAGSAVLLGLFSFTLPHTPPDRSTNPSMSQLLGLDAFSLLSRPSYAVFMISSVLICIPLAFYYQLASRVVEIVQPEAIAATMSYGQMSEIFFMLVMPLFFARLGVKWMLLVGMLAWVVRYGLFAYGAPIENSAMIIGAILLHGICYDFFFVTGQIYTDQQAPTAIRAQAQGLLVMLTLGIGMLIGAQAAGYIEAQHTTEKSKALAKEVKQLDDEIKVLKDRLATATEAEKTAITDDIATLDERKKQTRRDELRAIEWQPLWAKPAIFAAAVMLLFAIFFHDQPATTASEESPWEENDGAAV
jgi:nucleoside transporter